MPVNNPPRAQDYDNAHEDLQTIEDVVNGPVGSTVTSRLGRAIKTLADAINSIVDGSVFQTKSSLPSDVTALFEGAQTINVPTDQPTLQAAFDYIARLPIRADAAFVVNMETGFAPASGVVCESGNWSNVKITADDALVEVHASFTGNFIRVRDAAGPVLACTIDMNHLGARGYYLEWNATGSTDGEAGRGIINAGTFGIEARTSQIYMPFSVWDGSLGAGIRLQQGTTGTLQDATANGCNAGLISDSAIYVSRGCSISLMGVEAKNSGSVGLLVRRSLVAGNDLDVSDAATIGIWVEQGSVVAADGLVASGCGTHGVQVQLGGVLECALATVTNNTANGFRSRQNGTIKAWSATVTGNGRDLFVETGGSIHAPAATLTGAVAAPFYLDAAEWVSSAGLRRFGGGGDPLAVVHAYHASSQEVIRAHSDNANVRMAFFASGGEGARVGYTGGGGIDVIATRTGERVRLVSGTSGTVQILRGLPTSASGLVSGDLWSDGGTVKIVT